MRRATAPSPPGQEFYNRFLSTLSLRRATRPRFSGIAPHIYFYPRSPCGERHQHPDGTTSTTWISIHALLAESDRSLFSIHKFQKSFLSTLSLRRATGWTLNINGPMNISIHALLAESDIFLVQLGCKSFLFLSTLSLRRATNHASNRASSQHISIHALLAESDGDVVYNWLSYAISIHALLAESDLVTEENIPELDISIHALLAESDIIAGAGNRTICISIHALLAESDCMIPMQKFCVSIFLSTLSLRRATHSLNLPSRPIDISIHALLAESDF